MRVRKRSQRVAVAALAVTALTATAPGSAGAAKPKQIKNKLTITLVQQGSSTVLDGELAGDKVCAGDRTVRIRRDGATIATTETFLAGDFITPPALGPPVPPGTYDAIALKKKDKLKGKPVVCAAATSNTIVVP